MRHNIFRLALLTAGLALSVRANASTYEVSTGGQLDTLIGTATLPGTAHDGDRIHIQRGNYTAPAQGWKVRKSLEIFGDGPGWPFRGATSSTWLTPASGSDPVLVVDISQVSRAIAQLPNIYIHDLAIGQGITCSANPRSNGIFYKSPGGKVLTDFHLARVAVYNMGNDGIHLEGSDLGTGAIVGLTVDDCVSAFNCGNGLNIINATVVRVLGGSYSHNSKIGAYINACPGAQMIRNAFEDNQTSATRAGPFDVQLFLESTANFFVTGGHFENFAGPTARRNAIGVSGCLGGYIGSSSFGCGSVVSGSRGILLWSGGRSIVVGPNSWSQVDILVEALDDSTNSSSVVMPQSIQGTGGLAAKIVVPEATDRGNILMAPTTNTSNVTAGIAFPKLSPAARDGMTSAASGGTRREGLVIHNSTTHRLEHWDGTRWLEEVTTVPGSEINLTKVTANIDTSTTTRILTAPPSGFYRVSVYSTVTTAFTGNQAVPAVKIWWYGEGSEHSRQLSLGIKPPLGTEVHEVIPLQITGGQLHYQILGFSTGAGALSLRIRVEALP